MTVSQRHQAQRPARGRLVRWLLGLLILSGLIMLVSHLGELEQFLAILRTMSPMWLGIALLLQLGTYASVAWVWHQALDRLHARRSFRSLIPLAVAKLFSDQAMPSAGVSGTAFFVTALSRRGIPAPLCMAVLLLSVVSYYAAYLAAAAITVLLLWRHHAVHVWIVVVAVVFGIVAVAIPVGALTLQGRARRPLPAGMSRLPWLARTARAFRDTPDVLLRDRGLLISATLLQAVVFLLDAATLWVMLIVVGQKVSFWVAFPSFVLASMVATVGPVPLGLGTFEATAVAMLTLFGVPLEAALTATLLLRGLTLWLPMVPGLWLARRWLR